ncbi:MAG: dihydrodipicolinate synthase family protein [[Clostridium] innocuum]
MVRFQDQLWLCPGASGAVAGTSNVITEVLVELDKALRNGEQEKAEALQKDDRCIVWCIEAGNCTGCYEACRAAGITQAGPARKPVLECSAQMMKKSKRC